MAYERQSSLCSREDPLVILFGGGGRERIVSRLHDKGERIDAVITLIDRSNKLEQSIRVIRRLGIKMAACDKNRLEETLRPYAGSVLLSIGFPYILRETILAQFKLCLNVHPTLLPRYRGPFSGAYILMNNETEAGSTVHLMEAGVDAGPIILQHKVRLSRFDTVRSMQRKVYDIEPRLVADAMALLRKRGFRPRPQDEKKASVYPGKRIPKDSVIDPAKSLIDLFNAIRACDPEKFSAFFFHRRSKDLHTIVEAGAAIRR